MSQERSHHRSGSSKIGLQALCAASYYQEARRSLPDDFGERGEAIHKADETGDTSALDDFDRLCVERFADYCDDLVNGIPEALQALEHERKIRVQRWNKAQLSWGYADRVYLYETGGVVVDLKTNPHGELPPTITRAQLAFLAVGLLQEFPAYRSVRSYAYAPHTGEEVVVTVTREKNGPGSVSLETALKRIEAVIDQVNEVSFLRDGPPPSAYSPGPEQCARCRAANCPRAIALVREQDALLGEDGHALIAREPDGRLLVRDERVLVATLRWVKMAKKRLEAFEKDAKTFFEGGVECEGVSLRPMGESRSWADTEQVVDRLPQEVRSLLRVETSPPKIEAAYREAYGLTQMEARERMEEELGKLLRRKPKAPALIVKEES